MNTFVLYVWMVVAAGSSGRIYAGWVNQGEFQSSQACINAAYVLGIKETDFRCINKITGLQK